MTDPNAAVVVAPEANRPMSRGVPRFIRWLYTQNPFYILSADLVFLGLRMSFDPGARDFDTGALIAGLAGYTLLLAVTAWLLIRFGRVWDDVRSILLLVVMMFLAISVTFDEVLVTRPRLGSFCFVGGLLFAVVVSEGLLRGIRLKLPALFRGPYYLSLALFFLYPILLVRFRDRPEAAAAYWAVFGFSPLAGLVALTLLPAIRRGRAYLQGNGSPWRWPMYPWSLFVFLGLGVVGRSYYLCTSMHGIDATRSIFAPFFLVPFGLAVAALLVELGRVARHTPTIVVGLGLPLALIGLALVRDPVNPIAGSFVNLWVSQVGCTPAFAAVLAAVGFAVVAQVRHTPGAWSALMAGLAVLSVIPPDALYVSDLTQPRCGPLALIAALQAARGLQERTRWRVAVAVGCLILAVLDLAWVRAWNRPGFVASHLVVMALLWSGAPLDDRWGDRLRRAGAVLLLLVISVVGLSHFGARPILPRELGPVYMSAMVGFTLTYGLLLGGSVLNLPTAMALLMLVAMTGVPNYIQWRRQFNGLDRIVLGFASFLVAALISVRKSGFRLRVEFRTLLGGGSSRPWWWGKGKPRLVDDLDG